MRVTSLNQMSTKHRKVLRISRPFDTACEQRAIGDVGSKLCHDCEATCGMTLRTQTNMKKQQHAACVCSQSVLSGDFLCGVSYSAVWVEREQAWTMKPNQAGSLCVTGLVLQIPCALYCPALGVHIRYCQIGNVSAFRGTVICYNLDCNLVSIKDGSFVQKPIRGCSHRNISKLKYWFPCGNKY